MIVSDRMRRGMNFVVDSLTGMDGGIHYMKLCKRINTLEKQAKNNPEAAHQLKVIEDFCSWVTSVE